MFTGLIEEMGTVGLVGLFFWVALVYVTVKTLMLVGGRVGHGLSPPLAALYRGTLACVVAVGTASMFISVDGEPVFILFALAAILLRLARKELGEPLPLRFGRKDVRNVMFLEVFGVVVSWLGTVFLSYM